MRTGYDFVVCETGLRGGKTTTVDNSHGDSFS